MNNEMIGICFNTIEEVIEKCKIIEKMNEEETASYFRSVFWGHTSKDLFTTGTNEYKQKYFNAFKIILNTIGKHGVLKLQYLEDFINIQIYSDKYDENIYKQFEDESDDKITWIN